MFCTFVGNNTFEMGFFNKLFGLNKEQKESLDQGLEKTKTNFFSKIAKALIGKDTVDEEVLDQLEEALIGADVGLTTTVAIINKIESRIKNDKFIRTAELNQVLKEEVMAVLTDAPSNEFETFDLPKDKKPYVLLVVGVNGVGKTTTIGKLAHQLSTQGKKVVLGAADTFRAAAVDQLKIWGERANVPVVAQDMGSDPASVAYDTLQSAVAQGADVVLIDTAGRLHNKSDLMAELSKVKRVVEKVSAINEVLLVIDATTGQNGLQQAKIFTESVEVTGIVLTKLDGSAKGGVALAIEAELGIPIKWIGTGEGEGDFAPFDAQSYIAGLLA